MAWKDILLSALGEGAELLSQDGLLFLSITDELI